MVKTGDVASVFTVTVGVSMVAKTTVVVVANVRVPGLACVVVRVTGWVELTVLVFGIGVVATEE